MDNHLKNLETLGSGGAPLSTHIMQRLKMKIHPREIVIKEGYGMTECPLITRSPGIPKVGSVGKLVNNMEAKVVSLDTRQSVGPNKPGELLIKGPHIMEGYYNNENETKSVFENGWFKTGDIVRDVMNV